MITQFQSRLGDYLDVETVEAGDAVRLRLAGELDSDIAEQLGSLIAGTLERHAARPLEIDLAGLTFLDSSGARCLVEGHRLAAARGATLTVVHPAAAVLRVLSLLGIAELLGLPAQRVGGR